MTKENKNVNIFLITIDALRPDFLGCYGSQYDASPNIDLLAKKGVLFKNTYSPIYGTDPAHTTIFTGLLPESHGIYFHRPSMISFNDIEKFIRISNQFLSKKLKNEGYFTIAIDWLGRWHKTGFDIYTGISNEKFMIKAFYKEIYRRIFTYIPYKLMKSMPGSINNCESAETILKYTMALLKKKISKPLFLFLHFWDVHAPYDPPKKYVKRFKSIQTKNNITIKELMKRINNIDWKKYMKLCTHGASFTDEIIQRYIGAINYVDEQIGKFISFLKAKKMYDNSLIIINSDHGESLGEHGSYFDHHVHFQEILRSAFIMKFPYNKYKNIQINYPVHFVDIVPTILDFLGINNKHKFDGISLIPIIESSNPLKSRGLYFGLMGKVSGIGDRIGIIEDKWKYSLSIEPVKKCLKCGIIHHQKEELFNLTEDPNEKNNIINKIPEMAEYLRMKVLRQKHKKESDKIIHLIRNLKDMGKF